MSNESPEPDHSLDIRRIDAALANLRKQHVWDVLNDEEFKAEYRVLQRERRALEPRPSERRPQTWSGQPSSCVTYRLCGSIQGSLRTNAEIWPGKSSMKSGSVMAS